MRTLASALVVLAIALGAGRAAAQPEDRPLKKIEQFKKMKLLDLLDLSDEAASKFLVKYDKWTKDIVDLTQQRNDLALDLKLVLDKKGNDDQINGLLDKLVEVSGKLDGMKHDMFVDLRTVLTPTQAAKLAFFEGQFQRRLQESLNKLRRGGQGGGPGGPGGGPRWR